MPKAASTRATKSAYSINEQVESLLKEKDARLDALWADLLQSRPKHVRIFRGHRYFQKKPGRDWLLRLDDGEYSEKDKALLRQYSGAGGMARHGAKGAGLLQEFYTPIEITQACVELANYYGWEEGRKDGGSVLEPACGPGNFIASLQETTPVEAFELNPTTARITQILYPNAHVRQGEFECYFLDTKKRTGVADKLDEYPKYSLALGNPPFGNYFGRCAGMGERKFVGAPTLDTYFLSRSLDLLEPGGLLVFIMPASFLQNGLKFTPFKQKLQAKAVLLDAWRLWNGALYHTDELTDIVVLRRTEGLEPEALLETLKQFPPAAPEAWSKDNWFQQHPDKVLGEFKGHTGQWSRAAYSGSLLDLNRLYQALGRTSPVATSTNSPVHLLRERLLQRYA